MALLGKSVEVEGWCSPGRREGQTRLEAQRWLPGDRWRVRGQNHQPSLPHLTRSGKINEGSLISCKKTSKTLSCARSAAFFAFP